MLVNHELLFQRCRPWFVQVCQLVVLVASFFSISPATRRHFHREPPADIVPICSSGCDEGYKEAADTTQRMQLMTEKWATRPLQGMHNIVVLDVLIWQSQLQLGRLPVFCAVSLIPRWSQSRVAAPANIFLRQCQARIACYCRGVQNQWPLFNDNLQRRWTRKKLHSRNPRLQLTRYPHLFFFKFSR